MLKLDMINQALIKTGQTVVTAVEDSKASRILHEQYRYSLKAVLAAHPWDQFKIYATLAAVTEEIEAEDEYVVPEFDFSYQFAVPFDFCRLVDEHPVGYGYDRVRGLIYYDDPTFELLYVAFPYAGDWTAIQAEFKNWSELAKTAVIFDDILFNDTVADCVQYHMLKAGSYSITGDHRDTELFGGLYTSELATTKTISAQQKPNMFIEATGWDEARA